jgi:hypothetical protein
MAVSPSFLTVSALSGGLVSNLDGFALFSGLFSLTLHLSIE